MKLQLTFFLFSMFCHNSLAELHPRDLDGNAGNGFEGLYDDVINKTWSVDANIAKTLGFSLSGGVTYSVSLNAISTLNTLYPGYSNWRMPTLDVDGNGTFASALDCINNSASCSDNEFYHLYFRVLGGSAGNSINDVHNSNFDLFTDIVANTPSSAPGTDLYWTSTIESPPATEQTWFGFENSGPAFASTSGLEVNLFHIWAIHDGDIGDPVVSVNVPISPFWPLAGLVLFVVIARPLSEKLRDNNTA